MGDVEAPLLMEAIPLFMCSSSGSPGISMVVDCPMTLPMGNIMLISRGIGEQKHLETFYYMYCILKLVGISNRKAWDFLQSFLCLFLNSDPKHLVFYISATHLQSQDSLTF